MTRSILPTIPLVILGIIEPICLIWAYISGMQSPFNFFAVQIPTNPLAAESHTTFSPQSMVITLQLLNVFLLLAGVAIFCCFSKDPFTVKGYLVAVAFGDYGHIYAIYRAMGPEAFWDYGSWNDMVWGGVGVSAVLNIVRWATLLGVFGPLRIGGKAKTN